MTAAVPIPHYYLYGQLDDDESAAVELDFVHVEPIAKRSGSYDWTIAPHSHPNHYQVLYVAAGGGSIDIEDSRIPVETPCLMSVPVGAIHQIHFLPGTDGTVITAGADVAGLDRQGVTDLSPRWWDRLSSSVKTADEPGAARR